MIKLFRTHCFCGKKLIGYYRFLYCDSQPHFEKSYCLAVNANLNRIESECVSKKSISITNYEKGSSIYMKGEDKYYYFNKYFDLNSVELEELIILL